MPIIKKPLIAKCFQCHQHFEIKFVQATRNYSHKNDWDFWTEKEENKEERICNDCLVKLYKSYKWEFRELITNKKKQGLLRQYISSGIIEGKKEISFILTQKKKKNNKCWTSHA